LKPQGVLTGGASIDFSPKLDNLRLNGVQRLAEGFQAASRMRSTQCPQKQPLNADFGP